MKAIPSRPLISRLCRSTLFSLSLVVGLSRNASAEKILVKADGWEVFTDGRVAGFISQTRGDADAVGAGISVTTYPDQMMVRDTVDGGGWSISSPDRNTGANPPVQGTANQTRIRSGFLGNQFNFGVRGQVTPYTTVTGYISIWAFIESGVQQNKGSTIPADVRQGYAKLEGPWGSFLAGRTRTLFSRGATDIDVLYAHKWGVGFPSAFDNPGPTFGQVGFGVMGSGFAAAMIYGTPVLGGFHLNIGAFDPSTLSGGSLTRTGYPRAEAEATFERTFGSNGKIVLFVNGLYQTVYKDGFCDPASNVGPCETTAAGVGYGGRFEFGPVHIGLAGHYGQGLGLNYALENSAAAFDDQSNPRKVDGYYAQSQFVLGRFDLFAGAGITRIFLTNFDKAVNMPTAAVPDPQTESIIKYQLGINAGVVFNMTPNVHFDLDYFRAEAAWWLGEKQVLNTGNFGMTFNW